MPRGISPVGHLPGSHRSPPPRQGIMSVATSSRGISLGTSSPPWILVVDSAAGQEGREGERWGTRRGEMGCYDESGEKGSDGALLLGEGRRARRAAAWLLVEVK